MYYIFESNGGMALGILKKEDGSGVDMPFETEEAATAYANENCAFDWQIISF